MAGKIRQNLICLRIKLRTSILQMNDAHTLLFFINWLIVHKLFKLSPLTSVYHLRFSSERSRQTLHCHHLRHISFSSWLFLCIVGGEKKFFSWFVHSFSIKGVCIFLFYLNIMLSTHKHSLTNTHAHKFKCAIQAFHLSITLYKRMFLRYG